MATVLPLHPLRGRYGSHKYCFTEDIGIVKIGAQRFVTISTRLTHLDTRQNSPLAGEKFGSSDEWERPSS